MRNTTRLNPPFHTTVTTIPPSFPTLSAKQGTNSMLPVRNPQRRNLGILILLFGTPDHPADRE